MSARIGNNAWSDGDVLYANELNATINSALFSKPHTLTGKVHGVIRGLRLGVDDFRNWSGVIDKYPDMTSPSTSHAVYYGTISTSYDNSDPDTIKSQLTEFTDSEYDLIGYNSNYFDKEYIDAGAGLRGIFLFRIKRSDLNSLNAEILKFRTKTRNFGADQGGTTYYEGYLYIWNPSTSEWVSLGSFSGTVADRTWNPISLDKFEDANGFVWFKLVTRDTTAATDDIRIGLYYAVWYESDVHGNRLFVTKGEAFVKGKYTKVTDTIYIDLDETKTGAFVYLKEDGTLTAEYGDGSTVTITPDSDLFVLCRKNVFSDTTFFNILSTITSYSEKFAVGFAEYGDSSIVTSKTLMNDTEKAAISTDDTNYVSTSGTYAYHYYEVIIPKEYYNRLNGYTLKVKGYSSGGTYYLVFPNIYGSAIVYSHSNTTPTELSAGIDGVLTPISRLFCFYTLGETELFDYYVCIEITKTYPLGKNENYVCLGDVSLTNLRTYGVLSEDDLLSSYYLTRDYYCPLPEVDGKRILINFSQSGWSGIGNKLIRDTTNPCVPYCGNDIHSSFYNYSVILAQNAGTGENSGYKLGGFVVPQIPFMHKQGREAILGYYYINMDDAEQDYVYRSSLLYVSEIVNYFSLASILNDEIFVRKMVCQQCPIFWKHFLGMSEGPWFGLFENDYSFYPGKYWTGVKVYLRNGKYVHKIGTISSMKSSSTSYYSYLRVEGSEDNLNWTIYISRNTNSTTAVISENAALVHKTLKAVRFAASGTQVSGYSGWVQIGGLFLWGDDDEELL